MLRNVIRFNTVMIVVLSVGTVGWGRCSPFAAGHVEAVPNTDDVLTVDIGRSPYDALERILDMFEAADDYR